MESVTWSAVLIASGAAPTVHRDCGPSSFPQRATEP